MNQGEENSVTDLIRAAFNTEFWRNGPGSQVYRELRKLEQQLKTQKRDAAKFRAIEMLGGTAHAARGWNAVRDINPRFDRSTGCKDINCFEDLPAALQLQYVLFADGVLDGVPFSRHR